MESSLLGQGDLLRNLPEYFYVPQVVPYEVTLMSLYLKLLFWVGFLSRSELKIR